MHDLLTMTGCTVKDPGPVRIGVISDIHFGTGDTPGWSSAAGDLLSCVRFWQTAGITTVLQLGDLVEGPKEYVRSRLQAVMEIFSRFPGSVHHIIGNHCLDAGLDTYMKFTGLSSPWYSFTTERLRIIVLHGMDITVSLQPRNNEDRKRKELFSRDPWAREYSGAIGQKQLEWLCGELDRSAAARQPVVVCCHLPACRETTDERHGILWNHHELAALLCRYPHVLLALGGHYHPGGQGWIGSIPAMTLPAFSKRHSPPCFSCGIIEINERFIHVTDQQQRTRLTLPLEKQLS
ncbi:metallophosphoesterase [Prosthecochloris sp. HL-130-GSB]|uniref:metallophosphoesterase n=1 Tax=Prosthecochloris sp. HL-130-GSB TaxID=1974213 RepID=UPI000A1C0033|nr:metallophosphoesterase [Prosthecochloris sp. HL-130-GSB]ARM30151.1 hypothetical protein B9H02_00905 [Prosthecochloris sp. HL-130-GSB]